MKQVLIASSTAPAKPAGTPNDISGLNKGVIGFYALPNEPGQSLSWMNSLMPAGTKEFAIVLGRGANIAPLVIPEVDLKTLSVSVAEPTAGVNYAASLTIPTPTANENYTIVIAKLGKHFNERTNYTVTTFIPINSEMTAEELAQDLYEQLTNKNQFEQLDMSLQLSGATISFAGNNESDAFRVIPSDGLTGVELDSETPACKAFGDKAYVQDLASRGAAGKGFNDVYEDGPTIYPGYPEEVEDTTYKIYTFRFAVSRKSSKTRDEVVNQLVHICVPESAESLAEAIEDIFDPFVIQSE